MGSQTSHFSTSVRQHKAHCLRCITSHGENGRNGNNRTSTYWTSCSFYLNCQRCCTIATFWDVNYMKSWSELGLCLCKYVGWEKQACGQHVMTQQVLSFCSYFWPLTLQDKAINPQPPEQPYMLKKENVFLRNCLQQQGETVKRSMSIRQSVERMSCSTGCRWFTSFPWRTVCVKICANHSETGRMS